MRRARDRGSVPPGRGPTHRVPVVCATGTNYLPTCRLCLPISLVSLLATLINPVPPALDPVSVRCKCVTVMRVCLSTVTHWDATGTYNATGLLLGWGHACACAAACMRLRCYQRRTAPQAVRCSWALPESGCLGLTITGLHTVNRTHV